VRVAPQAALFAGCVHLADIHEQPQIVDEGEPLAFYIFLAPDFNQYVITSCNK